MSGKMYQYAAILQPEDKTEKSRVIVDLQTILAADDKTATLLAARAIPEEFLERLDEIEVVVRPF